MDTKEIKETVDRAFANDTGVEIKDQAEEISHYNERYRRALRDKVSVYDELVKAVELLAERNATFMKNEVELCRLKNVTSIT